MRGSSPALPSYGNFAAGPHFGQNAVARAFQRFVAARAARSSRPAGDLATATGCPGRPGFGGVVSRVAELRRFCRRAACAQNAVKRAFRRFVAAHGLIVIASENSRGGGGQHANMPRSSSSLLAASAIVLASINGIIRIHEPVGWGVSSVETSRGGVGKVRGKCRRGTIFVSFFACAVRGAVQRQIHGRPGNPLSGSHPAG